MQPEGRKEGGSSVIPPLGSGCFAVFIQLEPCRVGRGSEKALDGTSGMDLPLGGVKRRSKGEENLLLALAGANTAEPEGS